MRKTMAFFGTNAAQTGSLSVHFVNWGITLGNTPIGATTALTFEEIAR